MSFKEFDLPGTNAPTDPNAGEPLEFKLSGQIFTCHNEVPAGLLLDLASAGSRASRRRRVAEDDEAGGLTVEALMSFFEGALEPESYSRFSEVIRSPEIIVPMGTISDIASWLAEEYSDRPTGGNSSDTSNSRSSGGESTGVPSPGAVTYARSLPPASSTTSNGG